MSAAACPQTTPGRNRAAVSSGALFVGQACGLPRADGIECARADKRQATGLPDKNAELGRRAAGFTLIELLLVLVILGILAAVVVPKFAGRGEQARVAATKTQISIMDAAMDAFEIDNGRYPTAAEGVNALLQQPSGLTNWKGPYLKSAVVNDPWGNPYVYRQPGQHNTEGFDLYSLGPDGQEGTADDITNWTK